MEEKHKITKRSLLILLSLIFILSLIPLYYISIYAHPSADDYSYGASTKFIWEHTHSIKPVLHTALDKTIDKYYHWQGNFSAIFLMYLQPGIFGEQYYFIAPFFLLTSFLLFSFFFYYSTFRKVIKSSSYLAFLASILLLFFALQFTYVPCDSFYWYNGAVYYTFFYSLSLLLYSLLIWLASCKYLISRLLLFAFSTLLSFFVGGSNYATALLNVIVLFFVSLYFLLRKRRLFWYCLLIFFAGLAALLISISGPGNALRQSGVGNPKNPLIAILLSFVYGGYSAANATTVPVLLFWLMMIPIFWKILNKSPLTHRFSHPLLFFFFTFCIYSAQITPVIYAQGIRIPYRIRNIVCFNYYIFIAVNLFYLLGYLRKKRNFSLPAKFLPLRFYYAGMILAFVISCMGAIEAIESTSGKVEISNLPFSASAVYSLATGEAKAYDQEVDERIRLLSDPSRPDIVLSAFVHKPYVLYHSDISYEPDFWKNQHLAKYYNKRSVRLE